MALEGQAQGGKFLGTDMTGDVFAVLPDLEFVAGTGVLGAARRAILGEFAELHGADAGDLGEEICGRWR